MGIHLPKELQLWPVTKLVPYERNARTHSDEQVDQIAASIQEFGFTNPILVDSKNGIIAGHGRLMAAKKLSLEQVPVIVLDNLTDAQRRAYIIADNKLALNAGWDLSMLGKEIEQLEVDGFDLDLLGFSDEELADLMPETEGVESKGEADEVPEGVADPKIVRGEVFVLGQHRLMCGDSTNMENVETLLNGHKPEMVYTDPPYGIDVVSSNGTIGVEKSFGSIGGGKATKPGVYMSIKGDDTIDTAVDAFNLCVALDIPEMIFWGANYYASALPSRKAWIVWDKETTGNFSDCELAWCSREGAVRRFKHLWNGMIKGSERGEKRVHPTQKPVALAEWCFENYGEPKSVLDLFGGSGSTLIACEKTKRQCFMMEFEPHYVGVILDRWEKYTGKKAHREDGTPWSEIRGT